jgi:hypothetical protein
LNDFEIVANKEALATLNIDDCQCLEATGARSIVLRPAHKSARRSKLRGCDCHFPFLLRSLNPCTSSVYFNQENPCDEAGRREGDNRARNEPIKADPILARDMAERAPGVPGANSILAV